MKKASWGSAVFMAAAYGTNAVYQGYISKYYQQRGAQGQALSWLLVSFPLMSMIGQPLWGMLADRRGKRAGTLRIAVALSALGATLLSAQRTFGGLLATCCFLGLCYPAIQPMGDSVILAALEEEKRPYGPVRMTGCAAFAVCSLAAGRLLQDDYASVPYAVLFGLGCVLAVSLLLSDGNTEKGKKRRVSWIGVLSVPYLRPLLVLFMLLQAALGYFYSYYAIYFTNLPGGNSNLLGISLFMATVSEIPFLLWGDRLFRRMGAGRLLLLAAASLAIRFLLLGCCRSAAAAMASQLLHGLGFAVMTFSMAKYISCAAPEELRATGQTLVSAAGGGAARVAGSLAGGYMSGHMSLRAGFVCMSVLSFIAFLVFLPVFLRQPPLNGENRPE